MKLIIDVPEELTFEGFERPFTEEEKDILIKAVGNGTPLTLSVLADLLMEERIRGKLNSDTTFEKEIIRDVKCRITVDIKDRRPCYCGSELRAVWRESEENG